MNILIDYTQIPLHRAGVGHYALNLVTWFAKSGGGHVYYIVVQDDDASLDELEGDHLKLIKVKHRLFRIFPFRFLLEQLYLPWLILRHRVHLVHSLHFSFPLIRFWAKRAITFHDMTFFLPLGVDLPLKIYYFRFFIYLSLRLKAKLICVSETTRNSLLGFKKLPPEKLSVVPLGKSELFHPFYEQDAIGRVTKKHNINSPYFLFIGTIEPRKNIKRLIEVFKEFDQARKTHVLVIVGREGWGFGAYYKEVQELIGQYNLSGRVILTGYIDEAEKPLLISGADVFVFPSIYEGFGIPVVEAMACGVPVITSSVSSMPEVGGDAAWYIDPLVDEELLNAMLELAGNAKLKNEMKLKGLTQAAKYSWKNTAEKTLLCYEEMLQPNKIGS